MRTQSPQQIVTITNSGNAPLGITDVQLDPATSEGSNYVILARHLLHRDHRSGRRHLYG